MIEIEKRTGIYPMSWQSKLIWEYICNNYKNHPDKISTIYRDALKQNMANFMYILYSILESCPNNGKSFLIKAFLEPHYDYFKYSYKFNSRGEIIDQKPRHYTGRNQDEIDRYIRIAIESVFDYHEKNNRNNKHNLSSSEIILLSNICSHIENSLNIPINKQEVIYLVEMIEKRIISSL